MKTERYLLDLPPNQIPAMLFASPLFRVSTLFRVDAFAERPAQFKAIMTTATA